MHDRVPYFNVSASRAATHDVSMHAELGHTSSSRQHCRSGVRVAWGSFALSHNPPITPSHALSVAAQVSGQHAVFTTAGGADAQQLTRHLAEVRLSIPQWRQQRPAILVQSAQYLPSAVGDGTLLLRCASRSDHFITAASPRYLKRLKILLVDLFVDPCMSIWRVLLREWDSAHLGVSWSSIIAAAT